MGLTLMTALGPTSTFHGANPHVEMSSTSYANTSSANTTIPETYQSASSAAQPAQSSETRLMSVPLGLSTRRLINEFVKRYTSELPKSIPGVRCSLCHGFDTHKLWETKPSNLIRHIMAHNGVKWFQCPHSDCPCGAPQFTTK
ncbi:hypothetical protein RSAG8_13927, partial [Rhizoctonia solani AG-8 WAC10335]